jgi:hypothetical protein
VLTSRPQGGLSARRFAPCQHFSNNKKLTG